MLTTTTTTRIMLYCCCRFLTTDFAPLPLPEKPAAPSGNKGGKAAAKHPARILHDGVLEVWYRRDDAFQLPVAFLYFQLVSPLPVQSVQNAVLLDLLVREWRQRGSPTRGLQ